MEKVVNYEMIDAIVQTATSVKDAAKRLCDELYTKGYAELVYGYAVHLHGGNRGDVLFEVTRSEKLERSFYSAGGAATDFVMSNIENIDTPFPVDVEALVKQTRDSGDLRRKFVSDIFDDGHRTVWVSPIKGPGFIGYGVLNHSLRKQNVHPAVSPNDLSLMAYHFHQSLRRHGLLAKQFNLTEKEIETVKLAAQGRSAEDIAYRFGLSQRAVEMRLEGVRKKLKAQNTAETIYKACAYGVLN